MSLTPNHTVMEWLKLRSRAAADSIQCAPAVGQREKTQRHFITGAPAASERAEERRSNQGHSLSSADKRSRPQIASGVGTAKAAIHDGLGQLDPARAFHEGWRPDISMRNAPRPR